MFKQDSQSIQHLLVAEKRAEDKVNQARKRKILRLKQAKEDAQTEIEKLRTEKEKEFKEYESKFLGTRESKEMQIERDVEKTLREMEKFIKLNKSTVMEYVCQLVFTVDCEVHANFRENAF